MKTWLTLAIAAFASGAIAQQDTRPGAQDFLACQEAAQKNDWNTVITSCEKAVAANDEIFFTHYLLGWAYRQNQNWDKCAANYEAFLRKLGNQEAPEQVAVSNREGGLCFARAGSHAKAVPLLQKAASAKAEDATVQNALGLSLMRINRESEAERAFSKVTQLEPETANPYYYAGNINFRNEQLAKAQQQLSKYVELDPSGTFAPAAHFMIGSIIYRNAESSENASASYPQVKQHLNTFLSESPDAPQAADALYILGYIAAQEEDNDTAKANFEKFLQLRPTGPQADEARRFLSELSSAGG